MCTGSHFRSILSLAVMSAALSTFAQAPAVSPTPSVQNGASPDISKKLLTPSEQRQQQLAADTARLQILAEQLKVEMDKSTKDTLSLSVVKKASEVEKLAHKVRDEIRATLVN